MITPPAEETIFTEALSLPHDERRAYVSRVTAGNAKMRQRIEALLGNYEQADFLEHAADPVLRIAPSLPVTEKPGDIIGRYKLLQQIGEGGCGVVYVAEQIAPVRRRVALKIIKLGMDTKSVIARFEAERQALALMDHPNIAKVLDAGATETGRPYFVMELVRGMKITEYCDHKKLSTSARLDLFMQACNAIQHAHQKGIIHRDIKPSNILVTVNDGVAVPKVIDFGIAKATGGQLLTDKTIYTAFEQFIGTPAYMSPEQATLTSLDIDTRSDIYALGVLLYELLTGKTPFDGKELLQVGLDEMRRTIREQEPPRPSTRVSTLPGQELSTTAQCRGIDPPNLVSELRGDLDWIIMKALEKDRSRRYETANGLAADIQRHLNNEPVVACPPSASYRLRKAVRRNRLIFAAGGAVTAALLIGLTVAVWQSYEKARAYNRAVGAEKAAQSEAAKSKQVARFLRDMLKGVGPAEALGRDTTVLQEIVDNTVERIDKELKDQPDVEAEIRNTLGIVYRDLGQYPKSIAMHREALALRQKVFGKEDLEVARSLHDLGYVLFKDRQFAEAQLLLSQALAMKRKFLAGDDPEITVSLHNLAISLGAQGKLAEEESLLRQVLALSLQRFSSNDVAVIPIRSDLGMTLMNQGKLNDAENLFSETLTLSRQLLPPEHPLVVQCLRNLGSVLENLDRLSEAEKHLGEALEIGRRVFGEDHLDTATLSHRLAEVLQRQKKTKEAEKLFRDAVTIRSNKHGPDHIAVADALSDLAVLLANDRRWEEAQEAFSKALAVRKKVLGTAYSQDDKVARSLDSLGRILAEQSKFEEAERAFRESLEISLKANLDTITGETFRKLLLLLNITGRLEEAEKLLKEYPTIPAIKPDERLAIRARIHARLGRFAEAVADMSRAREANPDEHVHWHELSPLLVRTGQFELYREHCQKGLERFGDTDDPVIAERIAKDCLIVSNTGLDLAKVAKLADVAAANADHPFFGWFQLAKALVEFRQGHFPEAVEWSKKVLSAPGKNPERDVEAYMLLAMSHHHLNQPEQASAAFREGAAIHLPSVESGDIEAGWVDWIIAHELLREARTLVGNETVTAAQSSE